MFFLYFTEALMNWAHPGELRVCALGWERRVGGIVLGIVSRWFQGSPGSLFIFASLDKVQLTFPAALPSGTLSPIAGRDGWGIPECDGRPFSPVDARFASPGHCCMLITGTATTR